MPDHGGTTPRQDRWHRSRWPFVVGFVRFWLPGQPQPCSSCSHPSTARPPLASPERLLRPGQRLSATAATPSSATVTPSSQSAQQAAASLAGLLAQSATYRSSAVDAVNSVSQCGPAFSKDRSSSTCCRSAPALLSQLGSLPGRSALPGQMLQLLTGAWQASATADRISPNGLKMNSPRAAPRTIRLTLTSRPRLPLTLRQPPTRRRSSNSGTRLPRNTGSPPISGASYDPQAAGRSSFASIESWPPRGPATHRSPCYARRRPQGIRPPEPRRSGGSACRYQPENFPSSAPMPASSVGGRSPNPVMIMQRCGQLGTPTHLCRSPGVGRRVPAVTAGL